MLVTRNRNAVDSLLNNETIADQHNRRNQTSIKTIVLNIFTDNEGKLFIAISNALFFVWKYKELIYFGA